MQSNLVAASAVDPSNPTTDEFKAALKASITRVLAFKNVVGEPMALGAGGMVCVVPPSMMYAAMEAVNASIISNTSNVMQGAARVITFPWLTDTDRWYLLKTDRIQIALANLENLTLITRDKLIRKYDVKWMKA